jgi:putative ABC transport system permease protein
MAWWKWLSGRRAREAQLDSELRFHIEELTEANVAAGMSRAAARRQALLEFGGPEQIKEQLRDVHRLRIVDATAANLKSAFRFIRKSPAFSIAIILTLAICIGADSAVFSAIDAILLRPLPFPNADQLVKIAQRNSKTKSAPSFVAPVRLEDWNRMNSAFQAMTGYYAENDSETTGSLPEKVRHAFVAPRFLRVWGIAPAVGRDFNSEEEHFGGPSAVLISDRFWRERFAASPDAVGRQLRINGYSYSIVGVMPASFLFEDRDVQLWSPSPSDAPYAGNRGFTWYTVIGRMKPLVTLAQARANLAAVQHQLGKEFPETDADLAVTMEALKETRVGGVRRSLWILFGSVSLLLLIACMNIVALFLARATQRQHEISVRFSLGASRAAVIGQLLTEALVLAVLGAGLGLFVADGASRLFRVLARDLPRVEEIRLQARIVLYALGCSVVATLICGVIPAIHGTRRNIAGSLAQATRTHVSGRHPLKWIVVAVQVALAVTLLAGAGLLLRSFQALGQVSPGFEARNVLTFRVSASYAETVDWKRMTQRIDGTVEALRNLPGVQAAAVSSELPGVPFQFPTELRFAEGQQDPQHKVVAESRFISPGYFATMRIPLLEGELCREPQFRVVRGADDPTAIHHTVFTSLNVLVNRSFAETYGLAPPLVGHHLQMVGNSFLSQEPGEIRGIVGDAREGGMDREAGPTVYWCLGAPGGPDPYYLVRTGGEPTAMAGTIREKLRQIEPGRSVFDIAPLEEHLDDAFAENRMRMVLLMFFAGTAVSLACVGLYGTLNYAVSLRRREVGLRLALGALQRQIVGRFLLQGLGVSLAGCVAGWGLAMASTRVLSGMLYGVSPTDPATLCGVILLVLVVGAMASWVPAMRAARVEPMKVLREE